ncbi:hypothetical protein ATY81_22065 [Rhizobium sp. R72]|uniref:hypothetical protein n=1 Tax=unclassified Rhizobium TaxID=2613769 RepID=UPI000B6C5DE1|nr:MULTISPECIES: hypothetical protein [unclassified Rhizobium]OWW02334.1 hypothetical protein ATY81_22065 [Rhizobium sp. R72]OWW02468.1 hypothetical protein ATY80_22065 [Rhizobium sp. R711]
MVRRRKSLLDDGDARRFAIATVHEETAQLLRIIDEICLRYPPNDDLHFVRYLLRMIVEETKRTMRSDEP